MPYVLGIDTSNYTTSAAIFDTDAKKIINSKKLLPVKKGKLGLRQSDAVFHHTKQLPDVMAQLFENFAGEISAIGVSSKPCDSDESYMPCFLCGEGLADSIGAMNKIPVYKTTHQAGHILAALYSANRLDLSKQEFLGFHVSGGTTDCLYIKPDGFDRSNVLKITRVSTSLDLHAGQLVDRVGLMLGLKFPCGKELEALAEKSNTKFNIRTSLKVGNCCLSGYENKCRKMLDDGVPKEDIALYCLMSIYSAVKAMSEYVIKQYGDVPAVYVGGVMSNKIIRAKLEKNFEAYFADPEYSCDNAAGVAIYAALKEKLI